MQISPVSAVEVTREPSLEALSVLVVDDEPVIRESLEAYLQKLGVRSVRTAEDGRAALATMGQETFDYVFLDLIMPDMGGMELLKYISDSGKPIIAIVMTGYPSMEKVIEAIRHGASDFLVKPFRLQDVKISMERISKLHTLTKKNWFLKKELEQKEQVEKLNDELQKKVKEKTVLYSIVDSLSKISRPEDIYDYMVEKAAEACAAHKACFLIHDPSHTSLLTFAAHGLSGLRRGRQVPIEVDTGGRPLVDERFISDFMADPAGKSVFMDETSCHREFIAIPFRIRKEPFGLLFVAGKRGEEGFGREDEFLLHFLTERAALNIENMALYENLKENLFATLGALVSAIEARDLYTQQHSERVTQLAMEIAQRLGCSKDDLRRIEESAPLHDIGKIGIDDLILKKPGKLSQEEFERIKGHTLIGVNIVAPLGLDSEEVSIIRNHHERWDGRGYPDRLRGGDIPPLARILAVADAFDAMSSDRAYRKALPLSTCMTELETHSGSQFDPEIIRAALALWGTPRQMPANPTRSRNHK